MKCPNCRKEVESTLGAVIDSRPVKNSDAIRRRRKCLGCGARWTTYETIREQQLPEPTIDELLRRAHLALFAIKRKATADQNQAVPHTEPADVLNGAAAD